MEKDGIKIDTSKREDITSVSTLCITDYDSWPSDENPQEEGQPSVLPVIIVHERSYGTKKTRPRSYLSNV
jgi:hypothetical protein